VDGVDEEHKLFRKEWGDSMYWDIPMALHEEVPNVPPSQAPHGSLPVVVKETPTAMETLLRIGFVLREEAAATRRDRNS
jgi:hypothetical protein